MSLKDDELDNKMSQIFETLNLNSLSPEIYNLSSNELKNSLAVLGDRVIVGKFVKQSNYDKDEHSEAPSLSVNADKSTNSVACFKRVSIIFLTIFNKIYKY